MKITKFPRAVMRNEANVHTVPNRGPDARQQPLINDSCRRRHHHHPELSRYPRLCCHAASILSLMTTLGKS